MPETIALCPNARPSAKGQAEHFYHAFLLGLIARLGIRSNGQSGLGRYDICLIPRDASPQGIVMEIKAPRLGRKETLEQCLATAREQLEAKKYDTELADSGVAEVLRLAIAVAGKEVLGGGAINQGGFENHPDL